MCDAIAWINDQGRKSSGTVAWKKVTTHFISSWGLAGDDMREDSLEYAALATKVSATLRQQYRTARGVSKTDLQKGRAVVFTLMK